MTRISTTTSAVRDLVRSNQLVTVIGARGTGKTRVADELEAIWRDTGISVLRLDASVTENLEGLDSPLGDVLGCDPSNLTVRELAGDQIVRVIVDRCERLHSKPWLSGLQERWRALLSSEPARGRLAALLLGRPLFRQIAGGPGSPLLNLGPIITPGAFSQTDIEARFEVDASCARAVLRKTGGHPRLTELLLAAIQNDLNKLGDAIADFASSHQRYILRLIEDHPLGGQAMLADLLEGDRPVPRQVLIRAHFGSAHSQAVETLEDLVASGLVAHTEGDECRVSADLLRSIPALRDLLRTPQAVVPVDPESLEAGAALLFVVESRLRQLVADQLGSADAAWWATRVPPSLIGEAESRRRIERDLLGPEEARLHPLMYLSLGELFEVITSQENWDQVFRFAFPMGRRGVDDAAQKILVLRNRVAHSRPLSASSVDQLRQAARRLGVLAESD